MDIKVRQPQPLPPPPKEFTITLNEEEFRSLALICGRIGGNPVDLIRQVSDAIHMMGVAELPGFRGDPEDTIISGYLSIK